MVKSFTKQTPQLCQRSICGYNSITFASTQMVCWQILQLLLEISLVHPKDMHHEKTPWVSSAPFMFFETNLVIWLFSFHLQGTHQVILSLLCGTLIQHILGGAGPAVKFGTPLTISELPPCLWSYTMMFPCNIQKNTETAASQEFIYRPQKNNL